MKSNLVRFFKIFTKINYKICAAIMGSSLLVCVTVMLGIVSARIAYHNDVAGLNDLEELDKPEQVDSTSKTFNRINFLILGADNIAGLTDTILVACIDPQSNEVNILSIPRDTRVLIGKNYQKINTALAIGKEELVIRKIKEMIVPVPIHYYVEVDTKGFRNIIDILGGVDIDVPINMDYEDPAQNLYIHLKKGPQRLYGKDAEAFVRFRSGYPEGDIARVRAQQYFLEELINQKFKIEYISKAPQLFDEISNNIKTNFAPSDFMNYFEVFKNIDLDKLSTYALPGDYKYIDNLSYYLYDQQATSELLRDKFGY